LVILSDNALILSSVISFSRILQ